MAMARPTEAMTFREWRGPKALRPRTARTAPIRIRRPPRTVMMGTRVRMAPMKMRRRPVRVRSISFAILCQPWEA
jgi:hypothetical protein